MSLSVAAGRAIFDGSRHAGLWIACLAVAAAVAGGLVWRVSGPLKTAVDRAPYRRQAVALYLEAAGVAIAVIAGRAYESWIIAVTGVIVMSLFAVAFVRVPDDTATPAARVRRGLDGLFIAGCVLFSHWMLMPPATAERVLEQYYLVLIPAVAATAMAGIGVVAVIRATAHRRRYLLLVGSLSVVAAAHVGVVLASVGELSIWQCRMLVLVWGAGCLVSAGAAWLARRFPGPATAVPLPRVDVAVTLVPAVGASATALYHGYVVGPLGPDAIITAMAVVGVLSVRQVLARIDVRRYARVLSDREAYYRSIVSGSSDITTVVDFDGRMRFQAASAPWRCHADPTRINGVPFTDMVHPDDAATVERQLTTLVAGEPGQRIRIDARIKDADGEWRDTESIVADQRDNPKVDGLVIRTRDVGERRALERELAKLAFTDPLTTLSNRRALLRTLESDVAGGSMPCTLLAVDLDGFKNVNDTRGHDIGDAVLVEVAKRLRESLRPTDVAARLGGDEFAVLLWCPPERGYEIAERLLAVLAEPYRFDGHASVFLSSSIGLAGCATADDVQALLRNADLALRSAKQQGKNQIEAYDELFEKRVRRRNVLEHELHGAINRGELYLEYQPVISLPHRRVVGAEALLRWQHPTLGAVSPGEFIPVVEDAGLSSDLATWTLGQVAERLAVWKAGGHPAWVSINLSPRQLHSRLFATDLAQALLSKGVPPSRLVVEVTEHDVAQDMDILVAQLGALRGTGVRIALDDFGAGYSSLGQLHRLPVDILKIDRDLVAGSDEGAAPLADVVVRLGERLGLAVIAEGVETETQLDVVKQAGCAMVQGYLLARPMAVAKIDAMLRDDIRLHQAQPLAIES
ncbi:putative bifunctional diguanylate cyclase/phosphodiesterase [Stackebrandtia nassauensis]|uniref:putative bifunctional diguanylate cyclase/phosphodiesterase n=1 Tax=Stackebrandtia nassauensis TaxID=283811 RepID=UPI001B7FB388|nr:EAL domain-containing protein [Stackebrandtia nassauensis]